MGAYSSGYSAGYDIGPSGVVTPTPPERVFTVTRETGQFLPRQAKDPDATLDYGFDWSAWLSDGESIAGHVITVDGATPLGSIEAGGVVTLWLSGGVAGPATVAKVSCRITTDNDPARIDERTALIRIRDL